MAIAFKSFNDETGEEPCLIAWIHSHVGSVECNFSSVDLHTQFCHSKIYDGILGLVLEIQEDGQYGQYDFFELSRIGKRRVESCSKRADCNSRVQHQSCNNRTYYQSAKTKVILHNDFSLKIRNFMGTAMYLQSQKESISDCDDEDFELSKECKNFEDKNFQSKKRKLSNNESQDDFPDEPSVTIRKRKEKVAKTIPKGRKTRRTACKFCGKDVAFSYLIIHIEKSKTCREKCGKDLDRMKMEKAQEKREHRKNYKSQNKKKVSKQKAEYNKIKKKEKNERDRQLRQEKLDKLTKKDRYLNFKRSIIDGPNFVCQSCNRCLFIKSVRILTKKQLENLKNLTFSTFS